VDKVNYRTAVVNGGRLVDISGVANVKPGDYLEIYGPLALSVCQPAEVRKIMKARKGIIL
jgi:hypothetical protein